MKTIMITGASSGIGCSIALYFASKGWNVAATMRKPNECSSFGGIPNITCYRLDVTDQTSIDQAFENVIKDFGKIDVLVNNAGYGSAGVFEAADPDQIARQFETNVLGLMRVTQAVLPHFRLNKGGTIINISSMGGRITFPLYSIYHGTKWAVEGFTESLCYELKPIGIRVKLIEPGAIKTDFYHRSLDVFRKEGLTAYDTYLNKVFPNLQAFGDRAPGPEIVARKVFRAATDQSSKLRYPVGSGAPFLLFLRAVLPTRWFQILVNLVVNR